MTPPGVHVRYGAARGARLAPSTPITGPHGARSVIGSVLEDLVCEVLAPLRVWPATSPYIFPAGADSEERALFPDLFDAGRRLLVEVKAARQGRRLYLTEEQLQLYLRLPEHTPAPGGAVPLPGPSVSYALGTYTLPLDPGRYRTVGALALDLHPATAPAGHGFRRLLVLPAPVLAAVCSWGTSREYTTPLSPILGTWAPYRRAPSGRLWAAWGADPVEALAELRRAGVAAAWGCTARRWTDPRGVEIAEVREAPRAPWEGPLLGAAQEVFAPAAWADPYADPFCADPF